MKTTTLNAIRDHDPCLSSWEKLLEGLGKTRADDEPLSFRQIYDICGINDAMWAVRAAPQYDKDWRLLAVWCARLAQPRTTDWRATYAIQIAERYAHGMATREQLDAARRSAGDAAWLITWSPEAHAARAAAGAAAVRAAAAVFVVCDSALHAAKFLEVIAE